jgi:hypothetical protein
MTFVPAETLQDVLHVALPDVVEPAATGTTSTGTGSSAAAASANC